MSDSHEKNKYLLYIGMGAISIISVFFGVSKFIHTNDFNTEQAVKINESQALLISKLSKAVTSNTQQISLILQSQKNVGKTINSLSSNVSKFTTSNNKLVELIVKVSGLDQTTKGLGKYMLESKKNSNMYIDITNNRQRKMKQQLNDYHYELMKSIDESEISLLKSQCSNRIADLEYNAQQRKNLND